MIVVFLWLNNADDIRLRAAGSSDSSRVVIKHNGDLNTEDTLAKEDVADGLVHIVCGGGTGLDHVTIDELHGLGTLSTELTRHNDFTTLGSAVHDEAQHTVARTTDSQTHHELVTKRLRLGNSAESTVLHTASVEFDATLREAESLLNDSGELADAGGLLAKDVLGAGGLDDDLSACRGNTDLHSGIVIFRQLTSQELVEFSVEDTISNELAFLADLDS